MTKIAKDFRYIDPRSLDGTPFQVASATFQQAAAVGDLFETALQDAFIFARNAEMQRQLEAGDEPDGAGFEGTALGTQITTLQTVQSHIQHRLKTTAQAAVYDPLNPPEE